MGEMQRARGAWEGTRGTGVLVRHPTRPAYLRVFTNLEALQTTPSSVFMKATLCSHDGLAHRQLIQPHAPLSSLRLERGLTVPTLQSRDSVSWHWSPSLEAVQKSLVHVIKTSL